MIHALFKWLRRCKISDKQDFSPGVRGMRRLYRQQTRVIYEWDFGFPNRAINLAELTETLRTVVDKAIEAVA